MENVLRQSSADQSFSPYKQMKNQKRTSRRFVSQPNENLHRGILLAPPLTSYSYPPKSLPLHTYHHQQQRQQQQPPPLLPSPIHSYLPFGSPYLSCPPVNRKSNRTRDQSLKLKNPNSKPPNKNGFLKPVEKTISEAFVTRSPRPFGPDGTKFPKDVSMGLSAGVVTVEDFEDFSGSIFSVSPPPSSLPLPKFSLRPKLMSCNAEAAGVDAGATDSLRRLLRLR